MSPEDAAAVVGLYLRQRNEFTIWKGQPAGTLESNRGLFYWVLTRRMLPAGWRWFGACVASSEDQEISELVLLAQSALVRLGRALRARDRVLVQVQSFHVHTVRNGKSVRMQIFLNPDAAFEAAGLSE